MLADVGLILLVFFRAFGKYDWYMLNICQSIPTSALANSLHTVYITKANRCRQFLAPTVSFATYYVNGWAHDGWTKDGRMTTDGWRAD